jgi:hypothetical protein
MTDADARRLTRSIAALAAFAFFVGFAWGAIATAHADDLEDALARSAPHVTIDDVRAHVAAARGAAGPVSDGKRWHYIGEEMLLAMAWVESRYVRGVVSRAKGGMFCGFLQEKVRTARACKSIDADIQAAYRNAAAHLGAWLTFCRRAAPRLEPMACALAGYNGGTAAALAGRKKYVNAVRWRERRLIERWPVPTPRAGA